MALFRTDSIALSCSDLQTSKKWWIESFECKLADVPADWDCVLPSDIALMLPGNDEPTIVLSDWVEVKKAGYERANDHPIVFCSKIAKAHAYLQSRGVTPSAIQTGGGTEYFEVRDPEGNTIEICREPLNTLVSQRFVGS